MIYTITHLYLNFIQLLSTIIYNYNTKYVIDDQDKIQAELLDVFS